LLEANGRGKDVGRDRGTVLDDANRASCSLPSSRTSARCAVHDVMYCQTGTRRISTCLDSMTRLLRWKPRAARRIAPLWRRAALPWRRCRTESVNVANRKGDVPLAVGGTAAMAQSLLRAMHDSPSAPCFAVDPPSGSRLANLGRNYG